MARKALVALELQRQSIIVARSFVLQGFSTQRTGLDLDEVNHVVDPRIADLVPKFLAARRDDVAILRELVSQDAFGDIERHGHRMAGSGASFGFPSISLIGLRIERAAQRSDGEGVLSAVWWLEDYLDAIKLVRPPGEAQSGP